jgi:hypothetical protein
MTNNVPVTADKILIKLSPVQIPVVKTISGAKINHKNSNGCHLISKLFIVL